MITLALQRATDTSSCAASKQAVIGYGSSLTMIGQCVRHGGMQLTVRMYEGEACEWRNHYTKGTFARIVEI